MEHYFVKVKCGISGIEEDIIIECELKDFSMEELKQCILDSKWKHGRFISNYLNDKHLANSILQILNICKL